MERTLVIVKPDGVQRRLVGDILGRFEKKGFQILGLKMMRIDMALAEKHYEVHKARPFYASLVKFMTSAPVVVVALAGVEAVKVVRKMVGATFGPEAEPGTIRGDYGLSRSFNLIHASDSPETGEREVALFFKKDDLIESEVPGKRWVYDDEDLQPKKKA